MNLATADDSSELTVHHGSVRGEFLFCNGRTKWEPRTAATALVDSVRLSKWGLIISSAFRPALKLRRDQCVRLLQGQFRFQVIGHKFGLVLLKTCTQLQSESQLLRNISHAVVFLKSVSIIW